MKKFLVALVACLFVVSFYEAEAQVPPINDEWYVVYETNTCDGDGVIVYNYAAVVVMWGWGAIHSLRVFRYGRLRHCEYTLPYDAPIEGSQ